MADTIGPLQPFMQFKAFIFDLDGTLLDTLEDIADATNHVLRQWGLQTHRIEAYRCFVGEGIEMLAQRALPPMHRQPSTIRRCVGAIKAEYLRRGAAKTRIYDGIPRLLDALASKGIKTAILSNKPNGPTQKIVAQRLGRWHFERVVGADAGFPKKPDPIAAISIAESLAVDPKHIVLLGDSAIDMRTATAADMFAMGALWGFRDAQELIDNGAAILLCHPDALHGWLGI